MPEKISIFFFFLKKENIIQKLKFNLSSPPKNKEGGLCCFCCCFQPWALQMCDDVPSDLSLFFIFFYSCRKYLMVRSTAYQMIKKKKKHNKSDLTSSVFHAPNSDFSQIWNHIQLLNPIWKYIRFHVLFADQTAENLSRSSQKYQKKKIWIDLPVWTFIQIVIALISGLSNMHCILFHKMFFKEKKRGGPT